VHTDAFTDALGSRRVGTDPDGSAVERFELCPDLAATPAAEAALAARVNRLSAFAHPGFARVRRVERAAVAPNRLAIVSTAVPGIRLSDLLRQGADKGVAPAPGAVRNLARQVARAMADFHAAFPDLSHGTLGPERVVVCPDGRAVVVEPVLAPAVEPLHLGRTELWSRFRVPVPASAGPVRFDHVTDVVQVGLLVVALVLGRPIEGDEYPSEIDRLLTALPAPGSGVPPVSPAMRAWLSRASQVHARPAFRSAVDLAAAFEEVVAEVPRHQALASAVTTYLEAVAGSPRAPGRGPAGPDHAAAPNPSRPGPSAAVAAPGGGRFIGRPVPAVAGRLPAPRHPL
jgi:hypothetical protein